MASYLPWPLPAAVFYATLAGAAIVVAFGIGLSWRLTLVAAAACLLVALGQVARMRLALARRRRTADRLLRTGVRVHPQSELLMWRAAELTSDHNRKMLAGSLRRVVREVDRPSLMTAVPLNRRNLRPHLPLVRWLADQKGTGVYRQLEQGSPSGATAISQVMGEPFSQVFADFGLSLYTDSLPGLPRATAPAANRFTTRNLRQMWARLYTTSGAPLVMPVQPFPVSSDTTVEIVFPGTVTYFRLDTPSNAATVSVRFAGPGGAAFQSSLQPQLAIFRLPPGQ